MGLTIRSVQGGSLLVVSEPSEESLISFLTPHEPAGLNSPKRDEEPCHHFLTGSEKTRVCLSQAAWFSGPALSVSFLVCCQILVILPQSFAVYIPPLHCLVEASIAASLDYCSSLPAGLITFLFLIRHLTTQLNFLNVS